MPPEGSGLTLARALARSFAGRADAADAAGRLALEDVEELRASAYSGLSVPRRHGGLELSLRECVAAHIELATGSASTAMVAAMQVHIFGHQRERRTWSEEWFARLCEDAVRGGLFNSVASEPAMGSPSRGGLPATRAVLSTDERAWIVDGRKAWATGGRHLTHLLVRLRVEDARGVIYIPADSPGITWVETWGDALSLRASDSHELALKGVKVPRDHLLARARGPAAANVWFPMMLSSVYLGAAQAARDATITYALERVPTALGRPISTLPKIQRQLGEIDMSLQAARALLLEVAGRWRGEGRDDAAARAFLPRVAAAKLFVSEVANQVTERALQIVGGAGITRALSLERHFRDVRASTTHPPSGDTALELIGSAALAAARPESSGS
jgi:alkylation response protein AidB-like acyl-CoA dehydrogenase